MGALQSDAVPAVTLQARKLFQVRQLLFWEHVFIIGPTRGVCSALLGAPADWMLIGLQSDGVTT